MFKNPRVYQAKEIIETYFANQNSRVFTQPQINQLIHQKRNEWQLPISTPTLNITAQLVEMGIFQVRYFMLSNGTQTDKLIRGNPSAYEIAASLKTDNYLSHSTAAYLHKLTDQNPAFIYTTWEQSEKQTANQKLEQKAIDQAFESAPRKSTLSTEYNKQRILLLNGRYTKKQGVEKLQTQYGNLPVTNPERTVLDITVRPQYAGGCFEVLAVYKQAIDQEVSFDRMIAYMDAVPYIYPYQQAIGFYLERTGYTGEIMDKLKKRVSYFKFYLDYGMEAKDYSKTWKIYFPLGM